MNNTVNTRKYWILTVFMATLVALLVISGCDDDDSVIGPSYGQELVWTMERGEIGSNILHSIFFFDSLNGWAVGDNGNIVKYQNSTNVNTRWKKLNSGVTKSLFDIYFVDANTGWAVGRDGYILSTTDAGNTWDVDSTYNACFVGPEPIRNDLHSVFFLDSENGWAVGENAGIYRYQIDVDCPDTIISVDTIISYTLDTVYNFLETDSTFDTIQYYIIDTTFVYIDSIVSDSGTTFDTVWIYVDSAFYAETTQVITVDTVINGLFDTLVFVIDTTIDSVNFFPDSIHIDTFYEVTDLVVDTLRNDTIILEIPDTVFNVLDTSLIYVQSGWFYVFVNEIQNLWDIYFSDNTHGWAVGHLGTILNTTDGGTTWTNQASGLTSTLRAVHFVDNNEGWAVGHEGIILHTTDGGKSWHKQFKGESNINHFVNVFFTDASKGWVVNTKGDVYRTVDGGDSWYLDRPGFDRGWNGIFFINDSYGWIVGYDGNIMHAQKK